jgi:hypothetical protein
MRHPLRSLKTCSTCAILHFFINKVKTRSERARSASGTRKLDELAEQHSKRAENTRAKRPFPEVSGRRKTNAFNIIGSSPYFHKSLNTSQSDFCESMGKIGQGSLSGQPLAGDPKKLQKMAFLEVSGRRKTNAFNLVRSSPYFHKSSNTSQSDFCESMRKIGRGIRSGQPVAGHELFVGKKNRFVLLSRINTRAALGFTRPHLHYEVDLAKISPASPGLCM